MNNVVTALLLSEMYNFTYIHTSSVGKSRSHREAADALFDFSPHTHREAAAYDAIPFTLDGADRRYYYPPTARNERWEGQVSWPETTP